VNIHSNHLPHWNFETYYNYNMTFFKFIMYYSEPSTWYLCQSFISWQKFSNLCDDLNLLKSNLVYFSLGSSCKIIVFEASWDNRWYTFMCFYKGMKTCCFVVNDKEIKTSHWCLSAICSEHFMFVIGLPNEIWGSQARKGLD